MQQENWRGRKFRHWTYTVIATCRAEIPVFKVSSGINQATKKTAFTHFNIKSADTQSATETPVLQKALPHTDTLIPNSSLTPSISILQLYNNMNQVNSESISLPLVWRKLSVLAAGENCPSADTLC